MMSNELRSDERKALELLPWYVNGTLEGEERELVSRQVLASITCRKELERLRRLQQLIQRDDAEATATGRAFERLMARIEASGDSSASRARHPRQAFAWTRLALAASVTAAVSALLWWWADATFHDAAHLRDADQLAASRSGSDAVARRFRAWHYRIRAEGTARQSWLDDRRAADG